MQGWGEEGAGPALSLLPRLGSVQFSSRAKSLPLRAIEKEPYARRAACQGGRSPGETPGWGPRCPCLGSAAGALQRSAETHLGGMVQCRGPADCSEGRGAGGDGGGGMWTCRQSCHMGALPLSVMPSAGRGWAGSQKLPRWEGGEQVERKWNPLSSHYGGVSPPGMRNRSLAVGQALPC